VFVCVRCGKATVVINAVILKGQKQQNALCHVTVMWKMLRPTFVRNFDRER